MDHKVIGVLAYLEYTGKRAATEAAEAARFAEGEPWGRTQHEIRQIKATRVERAKAAGNFLRALRTAYAAIKEGADPIASLATVKAPEDSVCQEAATRLHAIARGEQAVHPNILRMATIK